jgi:dipeptidyl aminopeptidase/acylaminoacyl peptidase
VWGDAFYTMAPDGTNVRQITADALQAGDVSWSPDGLQIVFSDQQCATCATESDLFVMNLDGTGLRQLTDTAENETGADWSPHGRRIAFDSGRLVGHHLSKLDVVVVDVDGTDRTKLTDSPVRLRSIQTGQMTERHGEDDRGELPPKGTLGAEAQLITEALPHRQRDPRQISALATRTFSCERGRWDPSY